MIRQGMLHVLLIRLAKGFRKGIEGLINARSWILIRYPLSIFF